MHCAACLLLLPTVRLEVLVSAQAWLSVSACWDLCTAVKFPCICVLATTEAFCTQSPAPGRLPLSLSEAADAAMCTRVGVYSWGHEGRKEILYLFAGGLVGFRRITSHLILILSEMLWIFILSERKNHTYDVSFRLVEVLAHSEERVMSATECRVHGPMWMAIFISRTLPVPLE